MQTNPNAQEIEQQLFTDEDLYNYTEASTGQRFLNLIIDNILMRYGLSYLSGMAVGYILGAFFPEAAYRLFGDENSFNVLALGYLIVTVNYLVYYTFSEKVFNGYTLGKLITGTRAVRQDGGELTFRDAFLRSASRLVPFEAFSALGGNSPWHDKWTKTMVIKSR
ncbi:MAG: RDD family protein [Chitinophagaceae bacterium]